MADIIAAADQTAATTLLHDAEATLGTLSKSGGGSLGPFFANYNANLSNVKIVVGQTVFWSVTESPGVAITDRRLVRDGDRDHDHGKDHDKDRDKRKKGKLDRD